MKNLLILAAHEPAQDPRVMWAAKSFKDNYKVKIIGLYHWQNPENYIYTQEFEVKRYRHLITDTRIALDFLRLASQCFGFGFTFLSLIAAILLFLFTLIGRLALRIARFFWRNLLSEKLRLSLKIKCDSRFNSDLMDEIRLFVGLAAHFWRYSAVVIQDCLSSGYRADVILANDLDTVMPALLLGKKWHARVVYDAHEFYPFQFVNSSRWFISSLCFFERKLIKKVDEVVTVTPQIGELIESVYQLKLRVKVVPNCSPLIETSVMHKSLRKDTIFLFQGNFADGRGLLEIIDLWAKLPFLNAILHLRGPESSFKENCLSYAKKIGVLEKTVFFLPPVREDDLIFAASEADVGVIPYEPVSVNNKFCCPNKLSQYMQAGLPILSNNLPYVNSVISKYNCGLSYQSSDFDRFQLVVGQLLDESRRKIFGLNAREAAQKEFNWDKVSSQLLAAVKGQ